MNKIISVIILSIGILSGCSIPNKPTPDGYKGPLATIYDTNKVFGSEKGYFYEVVNIDGREIKPSSLATGVANHGRGFNMTPILEKRKVPAKTSILTVRAVTSYAAPILALGGGNYHVKGKVEVKLLPNENYYIKGHLLNSYKAVWVEDSKGRVVSKKIEIGNKPKQSSNRVLAKGSSQYSIVKVYNTTSGFNNLLGTGRLKVSIDGKSYGTIKAKEYIQVKLKPGKHDIGLSHWDLINWKSNHSVNINKTNTYLGITTATRTNVLSVDEIMPQGYKLINP